VGLGLQQKQGTAVTLIINIVTVAQTKRGRNAKKFLLRGLYG